MEILINHDSRYAKVPLTPSDGQSLRRPDVYLIIKAGGINNEINTDPKSVKEYVRAIKELPQEF